jgi:hypothetical protein
MCISFSTTNLKVLRAAALKYLSEQMAMDTDETATPHSVTSTDTHFGVHPFYIRKGTVLTIDCFAAIKTNLMWPKVKCICLHFNQAQFPPLLTTLVS